MKNGCLKFRSKRILFSAIVTTALLAGSPQFVFSEVLEEHAIAQTGTVKGQVVDENGEPIIGASVLLKGGSNGVITNIDGNFVLNGVSKGVLVISYIGYKTQEVINYPGAFPFRPPLLPSDRTKKSIFLNPITYHNYLIQDFSILLQYNFNKRLSRN